MISKEFSHKAAVLVMPGNEALAGSISEQLGVPMYAVERHRFPDGESLMTLKGDVAGCEVILVCTLDHPDEKLAPLLFAADAARELGASRVGLLAPYLAYMRQDTRFHAGEAVSARTFAAVLSVHFDYLITVDPHLHRYHNLDAIYRIPSTIVGAAPSVAAWIGTHVVAPLLIGPDGESAQWIEATAKLISAPFTVLQKTRRGDMDVSVSLPDVKAWQGHTPVLLDDIMSSGHTMLAAVARVLEAGMAAPICIGVHPILPGDAFIKLHKSGAASIVSCNTIAHPSNAIDLSPALAGAVRPFLFSAQSVS